VAFPIPSRLQRVDRIHQVTGGEQGLHPRATVGLDPDDHLGGVLVGTEMFGDQRVQPGQPGYPFGQPSPGKPVSRGVHDLHVVMIFCPVITDEQHRDPCSSHSDQQWREPAVSCEETGTT
jgi:hypothetical protein